MLFEKKEVNKFNGYNSNVAPELLNDELGTARDIMNLRCERVGKLVTRNGYRIAQYGFKDRAIFPDPDYLYKRNGGIIGLGEFTQSHITTDGTDRYLVSYIRSISTAETGERPLDNESDDIRKFPQIKNTAFNFSDREHLAAFIFSPVSNAVSGTNTISRDILQRPSALPPTSSWYVGQQAYECDLDPQDGNTYKKLYSGIRDLSVSSSNVNDASVNTCHRVHDITSHVLTTDSIDKRYASFCQYRHKLIVSDKLNGDMVVENLWDSETDRDERKRVDSFRIRANCVEDFDINKVYLDARLKPNQENSMTDGVETGMALYQFELEEETMSVSNPIDKGEAANPENYKVYQINPAATSKYPSDDKLFEQFFGAAENVMLSAVSIGKSTGVRLLNSQRIFTNADSNSKYQNLLGKLKLPEHEYYDDKEDKQVISKAANVYVWEDMQVNYYPSVGIDNISVYINADNRIADQSTSSGNRLVDIEVQDGLGRKAPIGGWRYRFVWDYGNGDYSAPSTEIMCPDIMWSASTDNDVLSSARDMYDKRMSGREGYQAVSGNTWDEFKTSYFENLDAGYNLLEKIDGKFVLSTMGKKVYDIKEVIYKDMRCKYGTFGSEGYSASGEVLTTSGFSPWKNYNAGDFCANILLKAPQHVISTKGVIAQFAAFDGNTTPGNGIEDAYSQPDEFDPNSINALFAIYKLSIPTFPYSNESSDYSIFERFAYMHGIFDYYGRYRLSYMNKRTAYSKFILMPSRLEGNHSLNISTNDPASFVKGKVQDGSAFLYYGVFHSVKANHANSFYYCIEGGLPNEIEPSTKHSDIHNVSSHIASNGQYIDMSELKPETLLRAYWNEVDSPIVLHSKVPAEVANRLFIPGTAGLELSTESDSIPIVPHKTGSGTYDSIKYGTSHYGWESAMPENNIINMAFDVYSTQQSVLDSAYTLLHQRFNFAPDNILLLNSGNRTIDGLYRISIISEKEWDGTVGTIARISQIEKLYACQDFNDTHLFVPSNVYTMLNTTGTEMSRVPFHEYDQDGNEIPGYWFGYDGYRYDGSLIGSSFKQVVQLESLDFGIEVSSTRKENKTKIVAYLPGHRLTLVEQLVSIFPSGLLHKCPRIAIKVPNRFVPKKAKRLLVYRTLNSLSNEYDPKSYGLVKAIDIRRATGSEDINVCEEDTSTGIVYHNTTAGKPKQNDAITSSYSFSDTLAAGGDGGGDTDYYKGIYFFDDVRDSILDFTNNPDQYEALRYALKSAHNIAIGERVYYGNVIQQYQPEAPVGMEHKLHTNDSAVANISFITGKTSGTGVGDSNTWVSYAYLFEDEMTIKSQVETTGWLQLSENSSDTVTVGEMRDIALYFMPGPYTNGIKRISIYRKVLKGQAVPSSLSGEYKINDYFYVGEINNDIDTEGIFVDDGLPNGHLLPIVKVDRNDDDSWVFDTPPNTDEYESGVFWSEPYRPDVINMENFMEFGSGDGSKITGLESQAGNIVVFKDSSIYRSAVQAENPPISRVDMVSRYEGCIAPNSLLNIEDMMYFLSSSGFMKYDNNVVTAADDAFHDELMFLLKSNESFNEEASAGYNQHFKEIYLNIPRLDAVVKVADVQEVDPIDETPVFPTVLGQTKCIVDTNDSDYYDTLEVQGADTIRPSFPESIFRREHYGHIFVINEHYQYTTKFAYPATTWKMREDNSSYFPIFAYHPLHLMRKYYTAENGVMYSGDIIPHWYGAADTKNNYKPALWAGVYAESPCYGDSALQSVDTNKAFGSTVYVQDSFPEMDMILDNRSLNEIDAGNAAYPCYPGNMLFPQVDSMEINSVYKSKFYTDGTETVLKRLRSAGINMFAKNNIRILYTQFPVESVDSGIRYTPLPEIFLSTNNAGVMYSTIQARYNYPPTVNVFDKWINNVIQGTGQNMLYFIPDTRMANHRYKGTQVPFNDDVGKPTKFSIEIYTRGRVQLNALTYHTRNIWSYLR